MEEATISGPWIDRLADHLRTEAYSLSATQKRMAAARQFLFYLEKQGIDAALAIAAHEQAFLDHKLDSYRRRHGDEPTDLNGWQWGYTSGIHMIMRLAQGQWPPATEPSNPQDIFRRDLCNEYAQWLSDVRGLAATTIPNRRAEARRFLESLGERGGDQIVLADMTVADLDHYVTKRAPELRSVSRQRLVLCLRGFLRYLHIQGLIRQDLSGTLIRPRRYAFESIPPTLRAEHVEAVLKAAEKDRTAKGLRDYAILLLLFNLRTASWRGDGLALGRYGLAQGFFARSAFEDGLRVFSSLARTHRRSHFGMPSTGQATNNSTGDFPSRPCSLSTAKRRIELVPNG